MEEYGKNFEPYEPEETKVFINTFHVIAFFVFIELAVIVLAYLFTGIVGCILFGGFAALIIYYALKTYLDKKELKKKEKVK